MFDILVVDDDARLNKSICVYLEKNGYQAAGCLSADEAYDELFNRTYDLIISDIMMPGIDGFAFSEHVRKEDSNIPILFVTARDDFPSKQRGFKIGIDDYMTKPVDLDELLLRIEALLRRAKINSTRQIEIGNFRMDVDEHTAYLNGEEVSFSVREFDILFKLLSYPKKTFTRTQLMNEFWDSASDSGTRTVDVYMTRIRNKTEDCDGFEIKTVHGLGYKAVLK